MLREAAIYAVRRLRIRSLRRDQASAGDPALRARIDGLGTWFHNIDIRGTHTKTVSLNGESLIYPRPVWDRITAYLPDLRGKSVLDVGCNAGYFSLDCKRRGAARVVGVDVNQGGHHDWLAQARFAAKELNLEIEYRNQDFFDVSDGPYDLVIFMGVLYHLEDPIGALAHLARLAREVAVVKSATTLRPGAVLEFRPGGTGQDPTSRWMPSARLIHERLKDVGFSRITRLRTFTNSYLAIARKN